jgi:hypothetical protein
MKNRLLNELQQLDLAVARLSDRRIDVINMLGTLATLVTLEPHLGDHMDKVSVDLAGRPFVISSDTVR